MKLTLEMDLDNDWFRFPHDGSSLPAIVAEKLRETADRVKEGSRDILIQDKLGNSVGHCRITEDVDAKSDEPWREYLRCLERLPAYRDLSFDDFQARQSELDRLLDADPKGLNAGSLSPRIKELCNLLGY